jgi:hypothetical protein
MATTTPLVMVTDAEIISAVMDRVMMYTLSAVPGKSVVDYRDELVRRKALGLKGIPRQVHQDWTGTILTDARWSAIKKKLRVEIETECRTPIEQRLVEQYGVYLNDIDNTRSVVEYCADIRNDAGFPHGPATGNDYYTRLYRTLRAVYYGVDSAPDEDTFYDDLQEVIESVVGGKRLLPSGAAVRLHVHDDYTVDMLFQCYASLWNSLVVGVPLSDQEMVMMLNRHATQHAVQYADFRTWKLDFVTYRKALSNHMRDLFVGEGYDPNDVNDWLADIDDAVDSGNSSTPPVPSTPLPLSATTPALPVTTPPMLPATTPALPVTMIPLPVVPPRVTAAPQRQQHVEKHGDQTSVQRHRDAKYSDSFVNGTGQFSAPGIGGRRRGGA